MSKILPSLSESKVEQLPQCVHLSNTLWSTQVLEVVSGLGLVAQGQTLALVASQCALWFPEPPPLT